MLSYFPVIRLKFCRTCLFTTTADHHTLFPTHFPSGHCSQRTKKIRVLCNNYDRYLSILNTENKHDHLKYNQSTKTKKQQKKAQSLLSINIVFLRHPSPPFPKAASRASTMVRTNTNCISLRISSATSCSTSLRFAHGRMTFLICAR